MRLKDGVLAFAANGLRKPAMLSQIRLWSSRQWKVAGICYAISLVVMGTVGETLPITSNGRVVPIAWWNYITLAVSPVLIGLIGGTFAPYGQARRSRARGATGAGAGGVIGAVAMACPICSPVAIPLFGTAGALSFLAPERGLIALLSIGLLAITLVLRLRATAACHVLKPIKANVGAPPVSTELDTAGTSH
jgi:hypothetical protein